MGQVARRFVEPALATEKVQVGSYWVRRGIMHSRERWQLAAVREWPQRRVRVSLESQDAPGCVIEVAIETLLQHYRWVDPGDGPEYTVWFRVNNMVASQGTLVDPHA